ncbi:hypothetical protein E1301_Tti012408 [Triplophysa tibetana]|uniref:Uncharacterized protein n=1 Tax=Triplophysa tibetana TaxID=1572043 RepID=A0A5A9PD60_9TELE|nr:hypothetical protein E1301_Tti012408 [Triplophysa tibetana]
MYRICTVSNVTPLFAVCYDLKDDFDFQRHTTQQGNRTNIFWLATNGTLAALTLTGVADPLMVSAEEHIGALVMWWSGNTRSTLSINGGVYSSWCHLAHSQSVLACTQDVTEIKLHNLTSTHHPGLDFEVRPNGCRSRESFVIGQTKQSDSIGMRGRRRDGRSACVVMQNESEVKRLRISGSPSTLNAEPNVE